VPASPIVFLSDFGLQDEFVGICHGVIARIAPGTLVIDLAHGVPRGDVLRGALLLQGALAYLPAKAVLLAVIDPGVGGRRRPVALRTGTGRLAVGPDNGVLSLAWDALGGVARVVEVTSPDIVLRPTSATFHGRDVFAPAAAHLARGGDLSGLGEPVDPATLVRVAPPEPGIAPGSLTARVLAVDSFGNVQLGAAAADLARAGLGGAEVLAVRAGAESFRAARAETYSVVGDAELVVLVDSSGRLAVARNRGDAAAHLRVAPGDRVEIAATEPTVPATPSA
jgi:S-adenosyl-L-methionine hydrolase (adenosine-forming)